MKLNLDALRVTDPPPATVQAKFFLTPEAKDRLSDAAAYTKRSMSELVDILILEGIPAGKAPRVTRTPAKAAAKPKAKPARKPAAKK